jgi:SHS2 domain-containing protein
MSSTSTAFVDDGHCPGSRGHGVTVGHDPCGTAVAEGSGAHRGGDVLLWNASDRGPRVQAGARGVAARMERGHEHGTDREGARGHRLAPHTADLIVEAWAQTRAACLEEAGAALVEAFCDTSGVSAGTPVPVIFDAGSELDLLAAVLEEIVYLAEVTGVVPLTLSLAETEGGQVAGFFELAPVSDVEVTGAVPKGVSYGDLLLARRDGGWFCHAVIDV